MVLITRSKRCFAVGGAGGAGLRQPGTRGRMQHCAPAPGACLETSDYSQHHLGWLAPVQGGQILGQELPIAACRASPKPSTPRGGKAAAQSAQPLSDNLVPFAPCHPSRLPMQQFLNCCWTLYLHKYVSQ